MNARNLPRRGKVPAPISTLPPRRVPGGSSVRSSARCRCPRSASLQRLPRRF